MKYAVTLDTIPDKRPTVRRDTFPCYICKINRRTIVTSPNKRSRLTCSAAAHAPYNTPRVRPVAQAKFRRIHENATARTLLAINDGLVM